MEEPIKQPAYIIDITLTAHSLQTRFVIHGYGKGYGAVIYFINGVEVFREDFEAALNLHTVAARSRLMPV